jgi:hypothetical protein
MKEIHKERAQLQQKRNQARNTGRGTSFLDAKHKKLTGRLKN